MKVSPSFLLATLITSFCSFNSLFSAAALPSTVTMTGERGSINIDLDNYADTFGYSHRYKIQIAQSRGLPQYLVTSIRWKSEDDQIVRDSYFDTEFWYQLPQEEKNKICHGQVLSTEVFSCSITPQPVAMHHAPAIPPMPPVFQGPYAMPPAFQGPYAMPPVMPGHQSGHALPHPQFVPMPRLMPGQSGLLPMPGSSSNSLALQRVNKEIADLEARQLARAQEKLAELKKEEEEAEATPPSPPTSTIDEATVETQQKDVASAHTQQHVAQVVDKIMHPDPVSASERTPAVAAASSRPVEPSTSTVDTQPETVASPRTQQLVGQVVNKIMHSGPANASKQTPAVAAASSGPAQSFTRKKRKKKKGTNPKGTKTYVAQVVAATMPPAPTSAKQDASASRRTLVDGPPPVILQRKSKPKSSDSANASSAAKNVDTKQEARATSSSPATTVDKEPAPTTKKTLPVAPSQNKQSVASAPAAPKLSKRQLQQARKEAALTAAHKAFGNKQYHEALRALGESNIKNKQSLLLKGRCLQALGEGNRLTVNESEELQDSCKSNTTAEERIILGTCSQLKPDQRFKQVSHKTVANLDVCKIERAMLVLRQQTLGQENACSCANHKAGKLCQHEVAQQHLKAAKKHPVAAEILLRLMDPEESDSTYKCRLQAVDSMLARECIETLAQNSTPQRSLIIKRIIPAIEQEEVRIAEESARKAKPKDPQRLEALGLVTQTPESRAQRAKEKKEQQAIIAQREKKAKEDANTARLKKEQKDAAARKAQEQRDEEELLAGTTKKTDSISALSRLLVTQYSNSTEQWKLIKEAKTEVKKGTVEYSQLLLLEACALLKKSTVRSKPNHIRFCNHKHQSPCKHEAALDLYAEVIKNSANAPKSIEHKESHRHYAYTVQEMITLPVEQHQPYLTMEKITQGLQSATTALNLFKGTSQESNLRGLEQDLIKKIAQIEEQYKERARDEMASAAPSSITIELDNPTETILYPVVKEALAVALRHLKNKHYKRTYELLQADQDNLRKTITDFSNLSGENSEKTLICEFQLSALQLAYLAEAPNAQLNLTREKIEKRYKNYAKQLHDLGNVTGTDTLGVILIAECEKLHDEDCNCAYEFVFNELWKNHSEPTHRMLTMERIFWKTNKEIKDEDANRLSSVSARLSAHPETNKKERITLKLEAATAMHPQTNKQQEDQIRAITQLLQHAKTQEHAQKWLLAHFIKHKRIEALKTLLQQCSDSNITSLYAQAVTNSIKTEIKTIDTCDPEEALSRLITYKIHMQIIEELSLNKSDTAPFIAVFRKMKNKSKKWSIPFDYDLTRQWFEKEPAALEERETQDPAFYYWYKGLEAQEQGRKSEAVELWNKSYAQDGGCPASAYNLGVYYYHNKEYQKAIDYFESGKKYQFHRSIVAMNHCYLALGKNQKALDVLKELEGLAEYHHGEMIVAGKSPEVPMLACTKKDCHIDEHCSHSVAVNYWERHALTQPEALCELSKHYFREIGVKQDVEKAIDYARRAYTILPENSVCIFALTDSLRAGTPVQVQESYRLLIQEGRKNPIYAQWALQAACMTNTDLHHITQLFSEDIISFESYNTHEKERQELKATLLEQLPKWQRLYADGISGLPEWKQLYADGTSRGICNWMTNPTVIAKSVRVAFGEDLSKLPIEQQFFVRDLERTSQIFDPKDLDEHKQQRASVLVDINTTLQDSTSQGIHSFVADPAQTDKIINAHLTYPGPYCDTFDSTVITYLQSKDLSKGQPTRILLEEWVPRYIAILKQALNRRHVQQKGFNIKMSTLRVVYDMIQLLKANGRPTDTLEHQFHAMLSDTSFDLDIATIKYFTEQELLPTIDYTYQLLKQRKHPLDPFLAIMLMPTIKSTCIASNLSPAPQTTTDHILQGTSKICELLHNEVAQNTPPEYLKELWEYHISSVEETIAICRSANPQFDLENDAPGVVVATASSSERTTYEIERKEAVDRLMELFPLQNETVGAGSKDAFAKLLKIDTFKVLTSTYTAAPGKNNTPILTALMLRYSDLMQNHRKDPRYPETIELVKTVICSLLVEELSLHGQSFIISAFSNVFTNAFQSCHIEPLVDLVTACKPHLSESPELDALIQAMYFYSFSFSRQEVGDALTKLSLTFPKNLELEEFLHEPNLIKQCFKLNKPMKTIPLSKLVALYKNDDMSLRCAVAQALGEKIGSLEPLPKDMFVPMLTEAWKKGMRLLAHDSKQELIPCIMSETRLANQMKTLLESWKIVVETQPDDDTTNMEKIKVALLLGQLERRQRNE